MANAQALMAAAFGSMPQGGRVSGGTIDSTSADAYYQTQLRQYVSQNEAMQKLMQTKYEADVAAAKEAEERAYKEHWANQTAQGIQQMVGDPGQEGGLINQPNISNEMKAALQMFAGNPAMLMNPFMQEQVAGMVKNTQETYLKNAQMPEKIASANLLQQRPDLLGAIHALDQSPSAKIADDLGLQGEARNQFIYEHAMKSGGTTVNLNNGDGRPQVNVLPTETKRQLGLPENTQYVVDKSGMPQAINTGSVDANKVKQHFDTMSNASKRLDALAEQVPDYNPAEFTDAMIRSLASDDSSIIGKVLNPLQSPASKAYGTAASEWVSANRAILSGAEVPETEFMRDLNIYFAKPGDTKEILSMKSQMRRDRIESLKSIASLPADQRAAAWQSSKVNDEIKLQGLSTQSPVSEALIGSQDKMSQVVRAWEEKAGRPATPEEIEKIKARIGGVQ